MAIRINDTPLVYVPVPKIACSSIKMAILAHNNPDLLARLEKVAVRGRTRHVHHVYPSRPFDPRLLLPRGDARWFCVVRDPLARFVSGYRNRILHHRDLDRAWDPVLRAAGLPAEPDLDTFALRLRDYVLASRMIRSHFLPMSAFLGTRPDRYDRVFDIRGLADLPAYTAEHGVTLDLPHEQTGGPKMSVADLGDPAKEAVRRFYAIDYRAWGAHFSG